ncbi:hypothetical protein [Lelliottia amnigena]
MSNFSTQAVNFQKSLSAYVDTRTGMFNSSLNISTILGNRMMGPGIELSLRYNPLNEDDIGFGKGYSLGLSYYDTNTRTLFLSSGEQYRITETNNQPIVNQQKLNSFIFKKDYDNNEYHIIWKSGVVETLFGGEHFSSVKLLKKITSSYGHVMNMLWEFTGQQGRLKEIYDDFNLLCLIKYNDNVSYEITVFPEESEEQKVQVYFSNNYVTSIYSLGKEQQFLWSLTYTRIDEMYILNSISHPTGLIEKVDYKSSVMNFPSGANLRPLPAVSKFTVTPGFGQEEIITTYDYSSTNYLGYGTYNQWSADKDYLFSIFDNYTYWVKEQNHIDGKVDSETTFKYNRFHLLTNQEYIKGSAKVTQEFTYYAKNDVLFEDQPMQYQLVQMHKTIYSTLESSRTTSTSYEFDEHGNPLLVINDDGSSVEYEYYDPAKDTEGPVDSHGFIKYVKKQTNKPPLTNYTTPIVHELNEYITVQRDSIPSLIKVVLLKEKKIYHDQQLTLKEMYEHNLDDVHFGRHALLDSFLYLSPNFSEKKTNKKYTLEISGNRLTQYTTVTTFDNLVFTSKNVTSLLNGEVFFEEDMHGNTVNWEYDSFRRIASECYNKGTIYEQEKSYRYSSGENGNITKIIDTLKNQSQVYFDGLGREIIVENNSQENSNQEFVPVANFHYDGKGNLKSQLTADHFFSPSKQNNKKTNLLVNYIYNDWGGGAETIIDDDFHFRNEYDPLLNKSTSYRGASYTTKPSNPTQLEITETTFDDSNMPVVTTRFYENHEIHSEIKREFDGFGRLRKEINELNHIVNWEYDISGRLIKQHLPDGSTVIREYADFSMNNLPTSISVISPENVQYLLGEQRFDGLERLIMTSCGGRIYTFTYDDFSEHPHHVILPNGEVIDYQYIPQLGNVISQIKTDGSFNSFNYINSNGLLREASNSTSTMKYEYYDSGFRRSEQTLLNKHESEFNTCFSWSSQGALSGYRDSFNKEREYLLEDNGLTHTINDSNISASYKRDEFGRVITMSVCDDNKYCITNIKYNDFNQEIFREIIFNDADTYTISLNYNLNGQISNTDTHHNSQLLRTEEYYYDSRNRLTSYFVSGTEPPTDQYGNRIQSQLISWDAINNHISCDTYFQSGSNIATFFYENILDSTQLTSIKNTHDSYPPSLILSYDLNGRLTDDGNGNLMAYNNLGQLITYSNDVGYSYDALGRLATQTLSSNESRNLYYIGNTLCGEVGNSISTTSARFIKTEFGHIATEEIRTN